MAAQARFSGLSRLARHDRSAQIRRRTSRLGHCAPCFCYVCLGSLCMPPYANLSALCIDSWIAGQKESSNMSLRPNSLVGIVVLNR
jgi:hypothetical protein